MRIRLTINGELISGELHDRPVARELAAMLPILLTFQDDNVGAGESAEVPVAVDQRPLAHDGLDAAVEGGDDEHVAAGVAAAPDAAW